MSKPGPKPIPVRERLLRRLHYTTNGCLLWAGYKNPDGYGVMGIEGRRTERTHVVAYRLFVGEIPAGLELDHLCRQRACANPLHLEPVTHAENMRRCHRATRETCLYGHPWTNGSTYINPSGERSCRLCTQERHRQPSSKERKRQYMRQYRARKRPDREHPGADALVVLDGMGGGEPPIPSGDAA